MDERQEAWSAGDFSIVRLLSNDREMTGGDTVAGRRSAAEGKGGAWDWGSTDFMDSKYALEKHEGMTGNCSIFPKKNIFLYG